MFFLGSYTQMRAYATKEPSGRAKNSPSLVFKVSLDDVGEIL